MAITNRSGATRISRRRRNGHWIRMLERLEERALLSGGPTIYAVTDTSDSATDAGSLRHAIAQANVDTNPAGSLIRFDPTVFSSPQTITLSSTLVLSGTAGPEVIDGPGASLVTINGHDAVEVFQVNSDVMATLADLMIAHGAAPGGNGGGISNRGTLALTDCTLSGNAANGGLRTGGGGGAIYSSGTLTLTDCTLTGNSATGVSGLFPSGGIGGGISSSGTLALTDCTLTGNSATGGVGSRGGGISSSGTLALTDCTLTGNSAGSTGAGGSRGGGISSSGTLALTDCTLTGNSTTGVGGNVGGGIFSSGTLALTDCTLTGNSTGFKGTGVGGGIFSSGTLALTDCTLTGNSATGIGGNYGGATAARSPARAR